MRLGFWKFVRWAALVAALYNLIDAHKMKFTLRSKLFCFFVVLNIFSVAARARTIQRNKILFQILRRWLKRLLFLNLVQNWLITLWRTSIFIANISFKLRLNLFIVLIILMYRLNLSVMLTIWYPATALEIFYLNHSFLKNAIDFF